MIIDGKTQVIMINDSKPTSISHWKANDIGYIDGYTDGMVAVVLGHRIILCDTWEIRVYTPKPTQSLGPK